MRDLPNLDFVRSIAVISVVAEHTLLALGILQVGPFPIAYLGVLGVLVFFVLTTLVLMWSLERKPHTLDFYIRRLFRIYPLVLVVIIAVLAFHAPVAGSANQFFFFAHPGSRDTLIQAALIQNIISTPKPVMTVMWSLPLEMQMYILLPPIFFFVRKNLWVWPLLTIWLLAVLNAHRVPADTVTLGASIGYFLPGVMAYVGFERWKPKLAGGLLPVFLIAMWAIFLPHCNFHRGWLFCLIVGLGLPLFHQIKSGLILAPSRQIAKYSYGIYLTHPFAIVIGMYLLRGHSVGVRLLGELVPLVVLPVLAYHLVERPMIRLGSRLAAHAEAQYEEHEGRHLRQTLATDS